MLLAPLAIACSTHSAIDLAQPSPAVTSTPGLVGSWNLDEGSGSTAADASGFGNAGTFMGGATWGPGENGTGVVLNAIDSWVDVPPAPSLVATAALTIAFWVKPQDVPATDERMVSKFLAWDVKFNGSGLYAQLSANSEYAALQPSAVLDTWQHIAFTFHLGDVHGYRNGVEVPLQTNTFFPGETLTTGDQFAIGRTSGGAFSKGTIDEVRLYRLALTSAQIAALAAD